MGGGAGGSHPVERKGPSTSRARFESRTADWLSREEATGRVLAGVEPLQPVSVALDEALGMALSDPLTSPVTLPPWDNAAMDGYAVRGESVAGASEPNPRRLQVVGASHAGHDPARAVEAGEAVRIMTGAPLPGGADTVVRVEDTDAEAEAGWVEVRSDRDRGRNVRPEGQDMRVGSELLPAGTTLGPGQIGVLAACGLPSVEVCRKPVAAVLSSGDELASPERFGEVLAGRAIPDTNGPTIAAAVQLSGGEALRLGVARDTAESVRDHVLRAADSDLLITIGGASMGEGDLFKRVLDDLGYKPDFWRVRIRPGSPFGFGRLPIGDRGPLPVFGLPGNPASAFVTFHLFVRPFIAAMGGHSRRHQPVLRARAGETMRGAGTLALFPRVTLHGGPGDVWTARLTGPQSSALLTSSGRAHALAVIPEGVERIDEGDQVDVMLLDSGPGWWPPPIGPSAS